MNNHILELEDLKREFIMGSETVRALKGISFNVQKGEFVTIYGQQRKWKVHLT
jgi:putative ABC transport system ATP-binding protein